LTSTPAAGVDRVHGASSRPPRALAAAPALAVLLLGGLVLRLTIAYILLPGSGFESDLASYTSWALTLAEHGAGGFYANAGFADYPPGYLYVLWLVGALAQALGPISEGGPYGVAGALIKVPPILADVAVAAVLHALVRRLVGTGTVRGERLGLLAAAVWLVNPVTWYDSAIWGQTDSVGALVMLAGVALLIRGRAEAASVAVVLAALVKPQFGIVLAPVVGAVLLRRHLISPGSGPRVRPALPASLADALGRHQGPVRLATSAVVAVIVFLALLAPFGLTPVGYVELMASTAGGYPYLSVNAYNPWALIGAGGDPSLASGRVWSSDEVPLLGPVPGVLLGTALLGAGFLVGSFRLLWRPDARSIVVVAAFLSLCFFILPTRVHERYLFPAFAFLPVLAVLDRRWLWATVALAAGSFINLHGILTEPLYATPNVEDLPLGRAFRGEPLTVLSVVLQTGVFAFAAWQLRLSAGRATRIVDLARPAAGGARRLPAGVAAADVEPPAPVVAGARGDAWQTGAAGLGSLAWLSDRLRAGSIRRDRSAELAGEPPGRIDRLDLLILAMVVLAALTLRTYRLDEPYDMHFDEVYHARTATEFLQDWRYGIDHSIYEYTHPHLAKYGIALGLIAFGNDRVTATSELGAPVTDAAIERRWSTSAAPAERHGDRLYVATGTDVRVLDLFTRSPLATIPAATDAIAVDETAHTLFGLAPDGTLWSLPTAELDRLRTDPGAGVPAPLPVADVGDTSSPAAGLSVVGDRIIARFADDRLVSVDPATGTVVAEATVRDATEVVGLSSVEQVIVDPVLVPDPATVASRLGEFLGEDAFALQDRIEAADRPVPVAAWLGEDLRTDIQGAIDDGSLPGVSLGTGGVAAVAGADGIVFLDTGGMGTLETVGLGAAASGLGLVDRLDDPTLYASTGSRMQLVAIRDEGPALDTSMEMPAPVRDVRYDSPANLVHVLGDTPGGTGSTVYVIEPHGKAVFADARLPFEPTALVMDIQPDRPSADRQQLIALSASGDAATVDVGSHAFAWRMPGVIMGGLLVAALYLLARVLFRRRTVAVLAAVLTIVGGMTFANARIAMNDTYVTGFIVAALAAFAPLYLGVWRGRLPVLLVPPVVGLLLGLALASKWVAAYAIGFVILLVLLRSALGRIVALLGMVALTGVLGYVAIRGAEVEAPRINATFLIIMALLTLLLAVAMVRRPVRFTIDELRFAVLAPALVGALLVLAGFALRPRAATDAEGLLTPTGVLAAGAGFLLLGALAYGASWVGARLGIGPLAPPRPVEPGEPVPAAAPAGWLRPGWAAGVPWTWVLLCVAAIPVAVYVASYLPWVALGNRLTESWPPGNAGQTLADLTGSMYRYHDELRATHAASSPWWAWPLDLKPVWFYQHGFADSTTGVIYDTGNLVVFWLAIPAVAFAAWQAWARRSLALTLVVLGVACLWLPWARIDRATFQYHVFTSLPFAVLALAYFLAELWHGPSPRTWLLARVVGALAILGPPLLWLLRQPLCGLADVGRVNPNGVACGPLTRSLTVAESTFYAVAVVIVAAVVIGWLAMRHMRDPRGGSILRVPGPGPAGEVAVPVLGAIMVLALVAAIGAAAAQLVLSPAPLFTLTVTAEQLAILALLLLSGPAWLALRGRDPRRWVVVVIGAAALFFVLWYPNLTGLPLPSAIAQAYLGLLPTWNYDFQFAVNQDPAPERGLVEPGTALLLVTMAALVIVAMTVARAWRGMPPAGDRTAPLGERS
jgi:dolichyl-phosphate-mannose--protein O-mannosyl transferase